jgi:hypothetical protein
MLGERFYFNLAGSKMLEDTLGLPFPSELAAFRSAQTLAKEIAETRPLLGGQPAWLSRARALSKNFT